MCGLESEQMRGRGSDYATMLRVAWMTAKVQRVPQLLSYLGGGGRWVRMGRE